MYCYMTTTHSIHHFVCVYYGHWSSLHHRVCYCAVHNVCNITLSHFPLPPFLSLPPPSSPSIAVPANFIGDGLVPNQVAFMGQPFVMNCNARGI